MHDLDSPPASPLSLPAAPTQSPTAQKKTRISKRLAEGIRLLVTGECSTHKAAALRAGLNYTWFCESLHRPHVRVFYERRVRESIAAGQMRATARLLALLDAKSEHVSADVATTVLRYNGIAPPERGAVNVNVNVQAGYVIDLTPRGREIREISGDTEKT